MHAGADPFVAAELTYRRERLLPDDRPARQRRWPRRRPVRPTR